jgi:prepilin-type N-terminal cleavage/methylation domain-containing protein
MSVSRKRCPVTASGGRGVPIVLASSRPLAATASLSPRCAGLLAGFTLVELMITVAIIGILAAIAVPAFQIYLIRARVSEGLALLSSAKPAIVEHYVSQGTMPQSFADLGLGGGSGAGTGGATITTRASFATVFGYSSDLWTGVEWQLKRGCPAAGACGLLVLRTSGSAVTGGLDIGLHLQAKGQGGAVRFRCVVNDYVTRRPYVPAVCREGNADDFTGW